MQRDGIPSDTLVLPMAAGARLIFRQVDELQRRTTGCGLTDAHTALVVRADEFFPFYERIWAELPEWEHDVTAGTVATDNEQLPPRTVRHPSAGGVRFWSLTKRGDDWFDWDTNLFHFYGGDPINGSMATYQPRNILRYVDDLTRSSEGTKSLLDMTQRAPTAT